MKLFLIIVGCVVGLVVLVFALLIIRLIVTSRRQAAQAAARLAPVMDAIKAGRNPDPATVRQLATALDTRSALYEAMDKAGRAELFPADLRTRPKFAESDLAFWLSHPNELQVIPNEIQLAQVITVPSGTDLGDVEYYLFRFRVLSPHWAADKGWMAGVSGPYPKDPSAPLFSPKGTFSELEPIDAKSPREHVAAFHENAVGSGALDTLRERLRGGKSA